MPQVYGKEDRSIRAAVREDVEIQFDSNPTTGYQWQPVFDETVLSVDEGPFQPGGPGIGVGGTQCFHVRPLQAGKATLRFNYVQPWVGDPEDTCEFELDIGSNS